MSKKKYTVLDLFCGCGGLSKGYEMAGYNVLLGVDFDEAALKTFEFNHHGAKTLKADLSKDETVNEIDKAINGRRIDVIVGGPPCQGFSLTGPRKFDDVRNKLYLAMIETVRRYRPKAFMIENVPGMASLYKGEVKDEILKRFTSMGYKMTSKIVCAADYGVPQLRRRLVFIGIYDAKEAFHFPQPFLKPEDYVTCKDAIGDLPALIEELGDEISSYSQKPETDFQRMMRGNNDVLYNHVAVNHKTFVKETIAQVPDGGNYKDLPNGVGDSRKFHVAWTRYCSSKPSGTIDTGHRNHFHYKWNRCPTVRENARLQSFPDDFVFMGNRTQQNRQVGNAVPPLMAKAIAEELKRYL
ncbi:MAG: DNA cytosine methyltransferase [Prevotella sp.]|nr:DNA cytosine methyltransferase [Prevotella sp.]